MALRSEWLAMTTIGADKDKARGRRSVDEELLGLLERLSLQMGTQGRLQSFRNGQLCPCCNCCRRCLRRPGPRRAASAPSAGPKSAKRPDRTARTATWVPSEAPAEAKSKLKAKSSKGAEKQRRSSKSLEDKAPSPRPRAPLRLGASVSVPQLRATVEVRPRRRATPKATTKRTPAPEPPPKAVTAAAPPSLPAPEAPAASEAKLRGRRGSRNLLAELAGDGDRELRWEPVTATRLTAFESPTRKLGVPPVPEPRVESAREIFYGSPEKPCELCPNCGRTFTEDSIFCCHCGCKRAASQKEAPSLSAVRFNPSTVSDTAAEPLNLDSATRQLEQLVQETHQALVRDGIINGEHSTVPSATPNLDAVDRALEELQRGLLEIDHVLAKPMPDAPAA